jgi:hypothetical protein
MGMALAECLIPAASSRAPMDRRYIALQIQAILVPYRIEHRRLDSRVMEQFRERARALLNDLDESLGTDTELRQAVSDARRELDSRGR